MKLHLRRHTPGERELLKLWYLGAVEAHTEIFPNDPPGPKYCIDALRLIAEIDGKA